MWQRYLVVIYAAAQFLDIRDHHRRLLPTGISQNLLPEEEEEEVPDEAESTSGADSEETDEGEVSDESEHPARAAAC